MKTPTEPNFKKNYALLQSHLKAKGLNAQNGKSLQLDHPKDGRILILGGHGMGLGWHSKYCEPTPFIQ